MVERGFRALSAGGSLAIGKAKDCVDGWTKDECVSWLEGML